MNIKIYSFFVAVLMMSAMFACKDDKVTSTGKPINDEKVEKLVQGMPIYDNMQGTWVDRSNPNRKIDIRGGKFKVIENGNTVKEAEFVFYKQCPDGCFPQDMNGTTPCFSLRSDKDLRCYLIQGIQHAKYIAFAEVTADSLHTQFYDWGN